MFNTREMRLANFHVITYAKKLATERLGRLMSQDSEMKQFRSEKSLMKFFFFSKPFFQILRWSKALL